jgi:hypothetical protein
MVEALTLGKDLRRDAGKFVGQRVQELFDGRCDVGATVIVGLTRLRLANLV